MKRLALGLAFACLGLITELLDARDQLRSRTAP
jgi:hypothetical protein